MRDRTWLILAISVLSSCAGEDRRPDRVNQVRDSVGAEIISSPFDRSDAPRYSLPSEPVARTGWDDGGPLLGFISYGRVLADGTVAVADLNTDKVLLFDRDLASHQTFGRTGEGPGEFGSIGGIAELAPDSLLVWDRSQNRATSLSTRDLGFRTVGHNPESGVKHTIAGSSDGHLLWIPTSPYARDFETSQWLEMPILRSDAAVAQFDTLVSLPFGEVLISGGRRVSSMLRREADFDAGPTGFTWMRLDAPELRWFDPTTGQLTRILRWADDAEPITSGRWDEWVDAQASQISNAPIETIRQILDGEREFAPEAFPLYARFEAASDGSIWIHPWRMPGAEESSYLVVSADGRCLMQLDAPDHFFFMDARNGLILGRDVNELGVHGIALYDRPECPSVQLAFAAARSGARRAIVKRSRNPDR